MTNSANLADNWAPVRGFPGYEVSQNGMIRSWRHKGGWRKAPIILKTPPRNNGYLQCSLRREHGDNKNCTVHRLVADAFLDGVGMVLHKDGNKSNNAVGNLYYGDAKQNVADAMRHGTFGVGEKHGLAKLRQRDVDMIRLRLLQGVKQVDLSREYGVHRSTISRIALNKGWKTPSPLPEPPSE